MVWSRCLQPAQVVRGVKLFVCHQYCPSKVCPLCRATDFEDIEYYRDSVTVTTLVSLFLFGGRARVYATAKRSSTSLQDGESVAAFVYVWKDAGRSAVTCSATFALPSVVMLRDISPKVSLNLSPLANICFVTGKKTHQ